MTNKKTLFVGLMCGTSLDGIDAVLVEKNDNKMNVVRTHSKDLDADTVNRLRNLSLAKYGEKDPIDEIGKLTRKVGKLFASATNELLGKITKMQIT